MIGIFDNEGGYLWEDEDGEILSFKDEIAARNFLFTQGYKEEFVNELLSIINIFEP